MLDLGHTIIVTERDTSYRFTVRWRICSPPLVKSELSVFGPMSQVRKFSTIITMFQRRSLRDQFIEDES